ncbi:VCBS repeat-containing protein [Amycolatopsis sp. NPDC005232]|uniref:FG-GAP repeat domain-containing protein n=1 Tax=Amycolatopsis sp. NPDC005232 TaxID=3157027 RepID=UPI0033B6B110
MRALVMAGIAGLLPLTLTTPAVASGVPEQWSTGPFTAQVAVRAGDVNGDGKDDLAGFNAFQNACYVKLSTGSGFQPQQDWSLCANSLDDSPYYGYFLGDVDNDGRADAITVRPHTIATPSVRGIFVARSRIYYPGDERFEFPTQWLDNNIAGDQANLTADLDGDGDTDVIGLSAGTPALAARSNGTTMLPLTAWGPDTLRGEKATLAADATGDGLADCILVDSGGVRVVPATTETRWFVTSPQQWSTAPFHGTKKTFTGDIDADGKADLIAVNDTDVRVMRSTGAGYSAPEVWYAGSFSGTKDTLTVDVDGDGDTDLVAVNDTDIWLLRSQ